MNHERKLNRLPGFDYSQSREQKSLFPTLANKIGVTKWRRQNNSAYFVWQKSYYDHIIHEPETELNNIRQYIQINPIRKI